MFKEFIRNHTAELVVTSVMIGISFAIGLAITGDFSEAFARSRRQ